MSVQRRQTPDGPRYDVRWTDGNRHRSRTFRTKRDAQAYEAELVRSRAFGGTTPDASAMRVNDLVERWLASGTWWSPTTMRKRRQQTKKWITPMLGGLRAGEVTRARVRLMRDDMLQQGATPNLVNEVIKTTSAMFGWAVDEDMLPSNPTAGLRRLRVMPSVTDLPSDNDLIAMSVAMRDDRDRAILWLLAGSGMRPGELCGLRWGDVHADEFRIVRSVQQGHVLPPKTGRGRRTPINAEARQGLLSAPEGTPDDYVVTGCAIPLNWDSWLAGRWRDARASAGVQFVPYALRHRRASLWIAEGVPLPTVAEWLGHTVAVLAQRYAHHVP